MMNKIVYILTAVLLLSTVFVGGVAAQEQTPVNDTANQTNTTNTTNTTESTTVNKTQNNSSNTDESTGNKLADVYVKQEHYISDSVKNPEEGVYEASGPRVYLYSSSWNHSNVVDFGVNGDNGSIEYDKLNDRYVFSTDVKATYNLYWDVEKNGSVTRYETTVYVDKPNWEYNTAGSLSELRNKSDKWDSWKNRVESNTRFSVEEGNELAIAALVFASNPLNYLTGGYFATWIILWKTPGGLLALITIFLVLSAFNWGRIKYANVRAARDDAQQNLKELREAEVKQNHRKVMQLIPLTDVFANDNVAEYVGEALDAENLYDAWSSYLQIINHAQIYADRLADMADNGYAVTADKSKVVKELEYDGDVISISELDEEDIANLVGDEAVENYNLTGSASQGTLSIDIDTLIDEMDIWAEGYDREQFANWMTQLLEAVHKHNYTDERGQISPPRAFIERMMGIVKGAEKYDSDHARLHYEHWMAVAKRYDSVQYGNDLIEQTQRGNFGYDDD